MLPAVPCDCWLLRLVARLLHPWQNSRPKFHWAKCSQSTGAAHRLPSDLDLLSDMRAESISVARQRVAGAGLAIFQRVVAAAAEPLKHPRIELPPALVPICAPL